MIICRHETITLEEDNIWAFEGFVLIFCSGQISVAGDGDMNRCRTSPATRLVLIIIRLMGNEIATLSWQAVDSGAGRTPEFCRGATTTPVNS